MSDLSSDQLFTLEAMRRCTNIMLKLCEVVPQPFPKTAVIFHQPTCARYRPKQEDRTVPEIELRSSSQGKLYVIQPLNRPYPEMGKCDCQPTVIDLTDEAKARIFDRVREILYTKSE